MLCISLFYVNELIKRMLVAALCDTYHQNQLTTMCQLRATKAFEFIYFEVNSFLGILFVHFFQSFFRDSAY